MPSIINSNIQSLNTQGNLNKSQAALATSIQRLSSGLRVNSAKDDAAGLSIAGRMTSKINGDTVAARNASDAISYAQTAEGALGKVSDALQRMRELAVQSANATNNGSDRANLQDEFKQLQSEVTRLTTSTKFNGQAVLAATEDKAFQVGSNTTDQITVAAKDLTAAANDVAVAATAKFSLNVAGDATENAAAVGRFSGAGAGQITQAAIDTSGGAGNFRVTAGSISTPGTASAADKAIVQANLDAAKAGLEAALKVDGTITGGLTADTTGSATVTFAATGGDATKAAAADAAYVAARDAALKNAGTATNARDAMDQIDKALTEVASTRANFGAVQNRFESVISNLQVSVENQSAARSRITDADYASETANLSRNQILQQAGTAMLAQANSLPNGVLALLRG